MNLSDFLRREWPALLFLLLPLVLIAYTWSLLPDQVASHWNAAGEVDGWMSKSTFVAAMGGVTVSTYLLLLLVLRIDPRPTAKYNQRTLRVIRIATTGLLCVATSAVVLFNVGVPVDITTIVKVSVPVLLLIIGNLFSKLKPSYFLGIRTPWTLESKEVWTKTHRMAGGLWVASALFLLLFSFFLPDHYYPVVLVAVVCVMVVVPFVYSYWTFRRQHTVQ